MSASETIDLCEHCSGLRDREGLMDEAIATLLTTLEVGEVVRRAAALLRKHFGSTRLTIWRMSGSPDEADLLLVDDPLHPAPSVPERVSLVGTSVAEALATGRPVTLDHLDLENPGGAGYPDGRRLARLGYGAAATFPLAVEGRILGALQIAHLPPNGMLCQCFQPADRIARLIAIALHNSEMVAEVRRLNYRLRTENTTLRLEVAATRERFVHVAESPAMAAVLEQVRLAAPTETTILLRGETGTGKEGIARLVHELSPRNAAPFVAVNVGALPEHLVESELFGHERGAFTGAHRRRLGRFQQARGGTLFLDEVGDAPLGVQVKLLRALQEREVTPVGGESAEVVDVRIVAATNRPLEDLVAQGQFRQDLYYRLNIFPVRVPPLRERREDLRPLAEHLLSRLAAQLHRPVPPCDAEFWQALAAYPWPGNVRELQSTLERALLLSPPHRLVLPADLRASTHNAASPDTGAAQPHQGPAAADRPAAVEQSPAPVPTFDEAVRALLSRALDQCKGRIYGPKGAAALLGLKPTTLQGKLRRYGLR